MRNKLSIIAVLIGIIGFLGGLFYSIVIAEGYVEQFEITMLVYLVYCVITSMVIILLLSVKEVLDNQERIYGLLYTFVNKKEKEKIKPRQPETKPIFDETLPVPNHIWLCPKCGNRNHKSFDACVNCGTLYSEENK